MSYPRFPVDISSMPALLTDLVHSLQAEIQRIEALINHYKRTDILPYPDLCFINMCKETLLTRYDELHYMMNIQRPGRFPNIFISHQPIYITSSGQHDRLLCDFDSEYGREREYK